MDCWNAVLNHGINVGLAENPTPSFVNHRRQKHYGGQESTTEGRPTLSLRESEKKAWFVVHGSVCRPVPER